MPGGCHGNTKIDSERGKTNSEASSTVIARPLRSKDLEANARRKIRAITITNGRGFHGSHVVTAKAKHVLIVTSYNSWAVSIYWLAVEAMVKTRHLHRKVHDRNSGGALPMPGQIAVDLMMRRYGMSHA